MKKSVHPIVVVLVIAVAAGAIYFAYQRLTGPPQYSEADRKQAIKSLLGVQAQPNQSAPANTRSLLMPQAMPPGQSSGR